MNNGKFALVIAYLLFAGVASASEYLCVVDAETGFHHDTDREQWKQASFVAGARFSLIALGENSYKASKLGLGSPWSALCRARPEFSDDSFSCESGATAFHFNRSELRFTVFRYFGYWNGGRDSLSVAIGQCFPD